jgi:hypothetical protein
VIRSDAGPRAEGREQRTEGSWQLAAGRGKRKGILLWERLSAAILRFERFLRFDESTRSTPIKSGAEAPLENSHELNQLHPQNSLSLLITYLRREAIANACGRQVYATAAGEPMGVTCSLQPASPLRQAFLISEYPYFAQCIVSMVQGAGHKVQG